MASKKTVSPEKDKIVPTAGGEEESQRASFSPESIKQFGVEVRNEFNKIAWPDKKHTMASTGVVIALVVVFSFYLGAVDLVLGKFISFLLN